MPKVIIDGLIAYNGEYVLDLSFTHRDFRTIKTLTGLRSSEVMEAIETGDTDIFVALASIALRRAGVEHDPDVLWDLPIGGLVLDFLDDEEVEEVDESTPPSSVEETKSGGFDAGSGTPTNGATDSSQETETPASSGIPQPDSTSVPATLTT